METYLRSRDIKIDVPDCVRYHPRLKHYPSGQYLPAMIAAVTVYPDPEIVAIHRTYLKQDGSGKADVEPNKMMLGSIKGGAVMFGPSSGLNLFITEGIENALTLFEVTGWPTYYEQTVPANISDAGVVICKHPGFEGIEYKATLKFFEHYHIRLPDTPLLNPEFSNPLFLKVFCQSINEAGLTEVPKGFSSLTNVFNFYLDNKYKKIAEGLKYDPKGKILPDVVSSFAAEMIQKKQRWIGV